jgi:hypothetical protein
MTDAVGQPSLGDGWHGDEMPNFSNSSSQPDLASGPAPFGLEDPPSIPAPRWS